MALWHWLLGGAGAYLLYTKFSSPTTPTMDQAQAQAAAWAAKIGTFYNVPASQVIILPEPNNVFAATVHGVAGRTAPFSFTFTGTDAGLDSVLAAAKATATSGW
jgi:hypothetical protein